MIGKRLKVNDYKLTYGKETTYVYFYGAFKNKRNGNKYAIYSYGNKSNLCYGSYFSREKEAVIMTSKENPKELIKELVNKILNQEEINDFEFISLSEIETIQIIDEHTLNENIDLNKLNKLTIPKLKIEKKEEPTKKRKPISIGTISFVLFILVVIAFFFVNPEVIIGKDINYSCEKKYYHKTLPASVTEEILLTFNGKGKIRNIDITKDHVFNDTNYYEEFKEKGYFYQYMEEGDSYKLIDDKYTYRLFSNIKINEEYLLPTEENELISYYATNNYTCKRVVKDE